MRLATSMVATVVLWLAFAGAANAQQVTFEDASTGDPCDPCDIHLVGESHITALPSSVVVSRCEDEFSGEIYADGTGEVAYSGVDDGSPECSVHECQIDPGEEPAPITDAVEVSSGAVLFFVRLCVGGPAAEMHCDLKVAPPGIELDTATLCEGDERRLEGAWEIEGENLEVVHETLPLEVRNEESPDLDCVVVLETCEGEVEGESHIASLPTGVVIFDCQDTFDISWNHDGSGRVHWTGVTESAPGCLATNCSVMSDEWPIAVSEEVAANLLEGTVNICYGVGVSDIECLVSFDVAESEYIHQYDYSMIGLCAGGSRRYEFTGSSVIDADDSHPIEFVH